MTSGGSLRWLRIRPEGGWLAWFGGFRPAEGATILLLHALTVLAAVWAIDRADWTDHLTGLPLLASGGLLIGLSLAKAEAPDFFAHITAMWMGSFVSISQAAWLFPELGLTWRDRVQALVLRFQDWSTAAMAGNPTDDVYLFAILMSATIWLVSYMSAWTLYRRRWLTASLLLPGFVILINVGYQPETGAAPLILYLVAGCTLLAVHHAFRRRLEWRSGAIPVPSRLPVRFLAIGLNLALFIVISAWAAPVGARHETIERGIEALAGPWESLQDRVASLFSFVDSPGRDRTRAFSQFEDRFDLGGPLNLSDEPIVLVETSDPEAPYLVAYRYDHWDGFGWRTNVDQTFNPTGPGGERYSPQVTFEGDQRVALSGDVAGSRVELSGTVTVLRPFGDLLFTRDTFLATTLPTSVQLSWRQFDGSVFPLLGTNERMVLPPDLRRMATLLGRGTFSTGSEQVSPAPDDTELATLLEDERRSLQRRLLEVEWNVEDGQAVALVVSGQVPVYDDVEAIYGRRAPTVSDTYDIFGLSSTANADQLRGAGTDYPTYIIDRYLPLPTTVTPRTRQLAVDIIGDAGATNPFDMSIAVQNDVRNRIRYSEDIGFPPDDQDVVDYVLFESREGYCEYFASSMAVMMRSLGVPARVVSGFFPAPYDPVAGGYVFRERNAHLWVEVYFPGYGWIPFEPTASQEPLDYGNEQQPEEVDSPPTPESPVPTPTPPMEDLSTPTPEPEDEIPPAVDEPPAPPQQPAGFLDHPSGWISLIGAIILAIVVVLAITLTIAWRRGLGGLPLAGALYARCLKAGRWLGLRTAASMTPAEFAREIGRVVPGAEPHADVVARLYMTEQYGGRAAQGDDIAQGQLAWRNLRRTLLRLGPRARFRRRR